MTTGLIVMILLGCGDGSDDCTPVRVLPAAYSSVAECGAAMASVLPAQSHNAYPVIAARCEPAPRVQVAAR